VSALDLRERIEAALRVRHSDDARVEVREHDATQWRASAYVGDPTGDDIHARPRATEREAIRALALAVGLDEDGADPRATVEVLRATLALSQESLAAAVRGERVTVVDEVARLQREVATLRAARMEPMSDAALDAACAAEDRATADEPLLDGTDGAHPAWWRGHDRAAEVWRERVATAERERDAAHADAARVRAAVVEMLAAHGTLDAAREAPRAAIGGGS